MAYICLEYEEQDRIPLCNEEKTIEQGTRSNICLKELDRKLST